MGLELFSPDDDSSAVVTTVRVPESINGSQLLLDLRDRFGITLAPGQGPLKGKVFRIGHLGYYDVFDITTALAGIELALAEAGADIERGVAVTRALARDKSRRLSLKRLTTSNRGTRSRTRWSRPRMGRL
jgi:aspartate aminotransferase-like enzyme